MEQRGHRVGEGRGGLTPEQYGDLLRRNGRVYPDQPPPDPSQPQRLETLDPERCTFDDNDLITHYDGRPIDDYRREVLADRAELLQSKVEDRSIIPEEIRNDSRRNPDKWPTKNVVSPTSRRAAPTAPG